ncbi:MAG: AbrB/MazE/SpoVT family DNA-binding domain-containing protein [Patescibacteria group bacterium]
MEQPTPPEIHGSVKVGSQGQVVIPVSLRKKLGINTGDSLIVFSRIPQIISMIPESEAAWMISMFEQFKKEGQKAVNKIKKLAKPKK